MNPNHLLHRAAALTTLLALTACYSRSPLGTLLPEPAARIVAEVTDSGAVVMGNAIGPGAVEVEGIVAAASADVWQLQVIRVDHRGGTSILWNRELVSFPRYAMTGVAVKRLDKTRSWIAAGIITASAIIAAATFRLVGSDQGTTIIPVPQESVIVGPGKRE